MADKQYRLDFSLSDGSTKSVTFTAPQGPKGEPGDSAQEPLIGSADDITPAQVSQALLEGRDIVLAYTDSTYGTIYFSAFIAAAAMDTVACSGVQDVFMDDMHMVMRFSLVGFVGDGNWEFYVSPLAEYSDVAGKLDATALPDAINTALSQAKASGEFKGDTGPQGPKGDTGPAGSNATVTKESIVTALGYTPAGSGTNSPLTGKKIVFDGDSISTHAGSYPSLIADKTACIIANQAVGGARLCANSENHSVVNNLVNLPTDGDIYCFQGGINDFWANTPVGTYTQDDYTGTVDPTTIYGAMETIFRYALTNFFGKAICFVITHKIQNTAYSKNTAGNTFWDYRKAMIDVCEKYSIPYYDAFTKSGLNGWHTAQKAGLFTDADGTHPTAQAYEAYYVPQLISLFESIIPIGDYKAPTKPVTYTNVIKTSVGTDGQPYNGGKGWKENTYLSYDGKTESTSTNYDVTGFIPVKIGDIIRLKNVQLCKTVSGNSKCMIAYHKSDFTHMGSTGWLKDPTVFTAAWSAVTNDAGTDVIQFTVPTSLNASLAYIRLCCGTLTDASIITINEEID